MRVPNEIGLRRDVRVSACGWREGTVERLVDGGRIAPDYAVPST